MSIDSVARVALRGPHVAIIMDGSGRWAIARGHARSAGHRAGLAAVRRVALTAPGLGIGTLTLFAFSSDNWKRPPQEIAALMEIFRDYLVGEAGVLARRGIRAAIVGRRDRLPPPVLEAARAIEEKTAAGRAMRLRIALDYSGQGALLDAAHRWSRMSNGLQGAAGRPSPERTEGTERTRGTAQERVGARKEARELSPGCPRWPGKERSTETAPTREEFERCLAASLHEAEPTPPVDLLIRTGGELRLSDCLLWELATAELVFTRTMWPEFEPRDLAEALEEFRSRERRFGALAAAQCRS